MAARNLKGIDLAAALEKSPSSAARWMRGEHAFRLDELEAIATWLDVPIDKLIPPSADESIRAAG